MESWFHISHGAWLLVYISLFVLPNISVTFLIRLCCNLTTTSRSCGSITTHLYITNSLLKFKHSADVNVAELVKIIVGESSFHFFQNRFQKSECKHTHFNSRKMTLIGTK
jgi:hypothetical protein